MAKKQQKESKHTLTVFLNKEKTVTKVIKPDMSEFNNDWAGLAFAITDGYNFGFKTS